MLADWLLGKLTNCLTSRTPRSTANKVFPSHHQMYLFSVMVRYPSHWHASHRVNRRQRYGEPLIHLLFHSHRVENRHYEEHNVERTASEETRFFKKITSKSRPKSSSMQPLVARLAVFNIQIAVLFTKETGKRREMRFFIMIYGLQPLKKNPKRFF